MNVESNDVVRHYQAAIPDRDELLLALGRTIDTLDEPHTAEQLAPLDQFHIGGLAATMELVRRAGVPRGATVLDAGSGLGGPSRYLAEALGCQVAGVDLSPDYVAIASFLAQRAGLGERVSYRVGDLAALPFENAAFDVIWTQHVVMNIRDRAAVYRELRRVLKPGGTLAFYDPVAADGGREVIYPVPWADTPASSTLLTRDQTIAALRAAGFALLSWDDVTDRAPAWMAQLAASSAGPLSPMLIVGRRLAQTAANAGRNLHEGRLRLAMGVLTAI